MDLWVYYVMVINLPKSIFLLEISLILQSLSLPLWHYSRMFQELKFTKLQLGLQYILPPNAVHWFMPLDHMLHLEMQFQSSVLDLTPKLPPPYVDITWGLPEVQHL